MVTLDRAINKSSQVEAAYQKSGSDLNQARARFDSAGRRVGALKAQFWSEMRRVSREMRAPAMESGVSEPKRNVGALLHPLKHLKKELLAAELERYDAKTKVESAVSTVVRSARQRDSFQELVATLKGKAARQREGHRQEEVAEGGVLRLGLRDNMMNNRGMRGLEAQLAGRTSNASVLSQQANTQMHRSGRFDGRVGEDSASLPSHRSSQRGSEQSIEGGQALRQLSTFSASGLQVSPQERSAAISTKHSVTEVVHTVEAGEHTLSLSFQLADGRSVGLQITAGKDSSARISIDPRGEALNSLLLRERSSLLSRLQSAGIKVKEIGIGSLQTAAAETPETATISSRNLRRRRLEDDSELES